MSNDPESTDNPDVFDIAWEAIAKRLGTVRTSIPAKIVSYQPTATRGPTVSARVCVRDLRVDPETGESSQVQAPVIHGVPVVFPGGSGGALTFGLSAGDDVLLLFADRSIDEWKTSGNSDNSPADLFRRFDLNDAIAIPIAQARGSLMPVTEYASGAAVLSGNDVRLGDSTAVDSVALSTPLRTELDLMWGVIIAVNQAVATGVPVPPPGIPVSPPYPGFAQNFAATKVKAK